MTAREKQISKALLDELHDLDGALATETLLHAGANLRLHKSDTATLDEFDAALGVCMARRWVTGVTSQYGGKRWKISDAGEAARLEMR